MNNAFPYDLIAKTHHMIVPLRHITEKEITKEELQELLKIKEELLDKEYEFVMEAAKKNQSIPQHFHLHLIITKETI